MFVIRGFKTARTLGLQGLRTLADVDAPVVGAVLNAIDLTRHDYAYYQYYYYKRDGYGTPGGGENLAGSGATDAGDDAAAQPPPTN